MVDDADMPRRARKEWSQEEVRDALLAWSKEFTAGCSLDDQIAINNQVDRCLRFLGFLGAKQPNQKTKNYGSVSDSWTFNGMIYTFPHAVTREWARKNMGACKSVKVK